MKKNEAFFVVSRFKEDISWIKNYTMNYVIYNKGPSLGTEYNEKIMPNTGGNQYDIFHFIYENYHNLPDIIIFVQAYPWDHCNEEKFKKLIMNREFTALESYEHIDISPGTDMSLTEEGEYLEKNNSWYIKAHNRANWKFCSYKTYDKFMESLFTDYKKEEWIRFSPGSQYLITNSTAMQYSRNFWMHMMKILPKFNMTEAHIVERALWYIFSGKYNLKESLK